MGSLGLTLHTATLSQGRMSGDYRLSAPGVVDEGWRVLPMVEMAKPEVQAEVGKLMTGPEQVEALNSGQLVILVRGEASPEKYKLIPATDPVPQGWTKVPASAQTNESVMSEVMKLMNSSEIVEGFNTGKLVLIERGEGGTEPEYGFVRRSSDEIEFQVPVGWKLLPILESQNPGVLASMAQTFALNESYCNEYNKGLLALTVKE